MYTEVGNSISVLWSEIISNDVHFPWAVDAFVIKGAVTTDFGILNSRPEGIRSGK